MKGIKFGWQKMAPLNDRMIPELTEESKFYGGPIPPWAKVDLPAWVEPYVKKLFVEDVAGIDRYHAYSSPIFRRLVLVNRIQRRIISRKYSECLLRKWRKKVF